MPDLVVHAFTDGRDTLADRRRAASSSERRGLAAPRRATGAIGSGRRALLRDGPRQALGPHRSRRTTCSSTAGPSTTPTSRRRGGRAPPTSAARPTSSSPPTTVGDEARIRPGDSVIAFNFRPDRMREITLRARRPGVRARSTAAARAPVERYVTLTEYEEDWPYPVAFPPARPEVTLPQVIADARRPPAARRRDREVPARDVLLRRRRGGPVARARSASSCPRRATCRPTTTSPR